MNIQITDVDDITIVVVDGILSLGSDQKFGEELKSQIERGRKKVILDMTKVKYIDSLGIGQIAGSYTALQDAGGKLVLARINEKIKHLLKLTGLQNHIQTYSTVEDAIGAL